MTEDLMARLMHLTEQGDPQAATQLIKEAERRHDTPSLLLALLSLSAPGQDEFSLAWTVNGKDAGISQNHLIYRLPHAPLVSDTVPTLAIDKVTSYATKKPGDIAVSIRQGIFDEKIEYACNGPLLSDPEIILGLYKCKEKGYVCSTFANLYAYLCRISGVQAEVKLFYGGFQDTRNRIFVAVLDEESRHNMKGGGFSFTYHAAVSISGKIQDPLYNLGGQDHMVSIYNGDVDFIDPVDKYSKYSLKRGEVLTTKSLDMAKVRLELKSIGSRGQYSTGFPNFDCVLMSNSGLCYDVKWKYPDDYNEKPKWVTIDEKSGSVKIEGCSEMGKINIPIVAETNANKMTGGYLNKIKEIAHILNLQIEE